MTADSRVDFGALGAKAAFPGKTLRSWGSCLVEPPAVGALRRRAERLLIPLAELSRPRSGIPTRVVDYFCVEVLNDSGTMTAMGLRSQRDRQFLAVIRDGRGALHILEKNVLKPMVRRPGLLEGRLEVHGSDTAPWHMFYVDKTRPELEGLRWHHTLKYIHYGETQDFPAHEGSRRTGGVPAKRPQVRVRPIWFQVPSISLDVGRVCWLKGRGDRHYAPSLGENILIPDNFQYSPVPSGLSNPKAFAAIANLSWAHLMAEIYGRRGGGNGVLHTYIRELGMMPLIDPRLLIRSQSDELVGLFESVAQRVGLPISDELRQPDRQALDLWAMRYLFDEDADDAARTIERSLRDLVAERQQRTTSGREQRQRAVRRSSFDPAPIAACLLLDNGMPPSAVELLDSYQNGELDTWLADVPAHHPGRVESGSTLLDQGDVLIDGRLLISAPSDSHSQLITAVLTIDPAFAGQIYLPTDVREAEEIKRLWLREWTKWLSVVKQGIKEELPRHQHAQRRSAVARELELMAGIAHNVVQVD